MRFDAWDAAPTDRAHFSLIANPSLATTSF